jgi:GNAT superfamily N-acetyltransferase
LCHPHRHHHETGTHDEHRSDDDVTSFEIRAVRFGDPDPRLLVEQVQQEYVVRYGGPDETPLDPDVFDPPSGAFFVGYLDEIPVAIGGWRFRSGIAPLGRSRPAEVKRMYVVPGARRRGLARRVLVRLEDTAREAGADVMVLETGLMQPEAIALYEASGYEPVEAFGHYAWSPNARYFGKPL